MDKTHAHKGVDVLINAVAQVKKKVSNIQLVAIGKGDAIPEYIRLTAELGIADVVDFPGFVDNQDLPKYFAGADVFVLPSTNNSEGFGMVLAEAMACGTPVIGTKVGGIPFVVEQAEVGLLVTPHSVSALSKAINKILGNKKLSQKNTRDAEQNVAGKFSWKLATKKLNEILYNLNRLRIVHVVASYPPRLGGMEKVVQTLAEAQVNQGLPVSVVTSDQGARNENTTDASPVKRIKSFEVAHTPIMPLLFFELLKIDKRSVVHLHIAQAYTPETVWLASKLHGFPYIAHIHYDAAPSGPAGFLLKIYKPLILKRVLRAARFVIVFTEDQKVDVYQKYGVELDKIKVIPNGVEDKFYYDGLRSLHTTPRLLFVGRLNVQKNVKQLLYALEGVSNQFETTIVGDGELATELKIITKNLKLENVKFVGRADGARLLSFYKQADIFILTSEREGMPLVLLEAMAMGLPIIAADVMGVRDLVENNKTGLLVRLGSPESLRAAMLKIKSDGSLYEKMNRLSTRKSMKYQWETANLKLNEQYEKVYN